MSECAKCNGWGVDDVTGFACPSCPTVKQSLTVEPVSNPDELAAAMQADAAPVAWKPIETAPKDGTTIDVWREEWGRETVYWGFRPHCCGEMGEYCDSDWHAEKTPVGPLGLDGR